ncbi:hypothetical protein MTBSS4_760003 [Magnetospirillum sp. SS-4]|nr:hypothetical protein MTBSS4_760003 [Magnetospirillum sp. SS-4]
MVIRHEFPNPSIYRIHPARLMFGGEILSQGDYTSGSGGTGRRQDAGPPFMFRPEFR